MSRGHVSKPHVSRVSCWYRIAISHWKAQEVGVDAEYDGPIPSGISDSMTWPFLSYHAPSELVLYSDEVSFTSSLPLQVFVQFSFLSSFALAVRSSSSSSSSAVLVSSLPALNDSHEFRVCP